MLVLTRKESETVIIGQATVTILSASRGRVSIGIDAPRDVKIVRSELVEQDEEEAA